MKVYKKQFIPGEFLELIHSTLSLIKHIYIQEDETGILSDLCLSHSLAKVLDLESRKRDTFPNF